MTGATFAAWLNLFILVVKPTAERPVLLIADNHASRFDAEMLQLAMDKHVHILLLPPNLTWLLQPADLSVFSPFKLYLRAVVDDFCAAGNLIRKDNVVSLLSGPWLRAVTPTNIRAGFAKGGVWPFNRSAIDTSAFSVAGSGGKPADAKIQESKAVSESKAILRELPADLKEVMSLPRVVAGTKKQKRGGTMRAMIVTQQALLDRLKAKTEKKEAAAKRKSDRAAAKAEKKAEGKTAAAAGAGAKPTRASRKRKRADAEEDEDEIDAIIDSLEEDNESSASDSEDAKPAEVRKGNRLLAAYAAADECDERCDVGWFVAVNTTGGVHKFSVGQVLSVVGAKLTVHWCRTGDDPFGGQYSSWFNEDGSPYCCQLQRRNVLASCPALEDQRLPLSVQQKCRTWVDSLLSEQSELEEAIDSSDDSDAASSEVKPKAKGQRRAGNAAVRASRGSGSSSASSSKAPAAKKRKG